VIGGRRKTYDKFGAYALLEHNGDLAKASAALALKGFGTYWDVEAKEYRQNPRPKRTKAAGGGGDSTGLSTNGDGHDDRRPIEITTERLKAVEEAIQALATDRDLYYRGNCLVTVVTQAEDTVKLAGSAKIRGVLGSPKVVELSEANLSCRLTKVATFFRLRKD